MGAVNTSLCHQTSRVDSETLSQATNTRGLCQRGEIGIPVMYVMECGKPRGRMLFLQMYDARWVRGRVESGKKEYGNRCMVVECGLRNVVPDGAA